MQRQFGSVAVAAGSSTGGPFAVEAELVMVSGFDRVGLAAGCSFL